MHIGGSQLSLGSDIERSRLKLPHHVCPNWINKLMSKSELVKPYVNGLVISSHSPLTPPHALEATHEPKPKAIQPQCSLVSHIQQVTKPWIDLSYELKVLEDVRPNRFELPQMNQSSDWWTENVA